MHQIVKLAVYIIQTKEQLNNDYVTNYYPIKETHTW